MSGPFHAMMGRIANALPPKEITERIGVWATGVAMILGGMFLNYAIRMKADPEDAALPMRTFKFSITYLAILFAALLVDHYFLLQLSI